MHAALLATTLRSIARLEAAGVREPRLTEPDHARWHRFRRKLGWRAFIEIMHEDLAGAFPVPFDLARWPEDPRRSLTEEEAGAIVASAASAAEIHLDTTSFLREAARALGLPASGALSELTKVQPHHQIVELPGSGGRIAAALAAANTGLSLHDQITFVVGSTAEHVAIGLATVELRANEPRILSVAELRAAKAAGKTFDRVFGLRESPLAVELADTIFPEARLV